MITNRLNTVRDADSIIVLRNAVVAEQGTHAELLSLDGVHTEMALTPSASSHSGAAHVVGAGGPEVAWRIH